MDLARIKELVNIFADGDLAELNYREGDCQLRLVRRAHGMVDSASGPDFAHPSQPITDGVGPHSSQADALGRDHFDDQTSTSHEKEILAPMHGILHLTPSPDAPAFVQLGETVQVGQTLAVLEAMKMFHALQSDVGGRVVAILASSGSEVAAGQPLFRIT